MRRFIPWAVLTILSFAAPLPAAIDSPGATRAGMATADGFRLEEFLGRTWRNDVVRFPLAGSSLAHGGAGIRPRLAESDRLERCENLGM